MVSMLTDPDVRRYLGGAVSAEKAREAIHPEGELWGYFVAQEVATGDLIGTVGCELKRGRWELSYQFVQSSWGRGICSAAIGLVVAWFFASTDEPELTAMTQAANHRSRRALERLGAQPTAEYEYRTFPVIDYVFSRNVEVLTSEIPW